MAQEKKIETLIKDILTKERLSGKGVFFYKQFQNGGSIDGLPDIICCCGGLFVGIEVKAPNGRISDRQIVIAKNIAMSGGIYVLSDNENVFKAWFASFVGDPGAYVASIVNLTLEKVDFGEPKNDSAAAAETPGAKA